MQPLDKISDIMFRSFFLTADKITKYIYRISNGAIGHQQASFRILLLSTIGRKSGLVRTHSLLYVRVDEGLVVVASNGGNDQHPQWYLNLLKNPHVQIQVGRKRFDVFAQVEESTKREVLWKKLQREWPYYNRYQEGTSRIFPIILFSMRKLISTADGGDLENVIVW